MRVEDGKKLVRRAKHISETKLPELADTFLKVPLEYYRSEEYAKRELDIFATVPLTVAHSSQIANSYDYMVHSVLDRSLLITRNSEGKARIFLNSCRHRGAEPAQGCGNKRRFTCPYHAWSYNNDGKLVSLPLDDRYEGMNYDEMGLVELPSEERHGLIWVILTPGLEIDVAKHLGELDDEFSTFGWEDFIYMGQPRDTTLESNWKGTAEGFLESWHVPFVHANTFNKYHTSIAFDLAGYDQIGRHIRWFDLSVATEGAGDFDVDGLDEDNFDVRNYLNVIYWIYPNLTLVRTSSLQGGGTIFINYYPGKTPLDCNLRVGYFSPGPLNNPEKIANEEAMSSESVRAVVEEDAVILASCGRGLRSGHEYALIGRNEKGVQLLVETLAKSIGCEVIKV